MRDHSVLSVYAYGRISVCRRMVKFIPFNRVRLMNEALTVLENLTRETRKPGFQVRSRSLSRNRCFPGQASRTGPKLHEAKSHDVRFNGVL
jgi:hypothetical protein